MCGIVGLWNLDDRISPDDVASMRDTLAHRGPDAAGLRIDAEANVGFGHRRLSILDLSDAGAQPMTSDSGRTMIVLNGEIYNYRDLREEALAWGCSFRSHSDTEVVLAYYERFGISCLERFRGMFALALWDRSERVLHLVRDRVGIKPVYYYWDGRTFAFASECRAFQALDRFERRLDVTALYDYFTYQYIPPPKTIFRNVRKLEAGTMLTFEPDERRIRTARYWTLPDVGTGTVEPDEAIDRADAMVREAIEYHLVSDVPVGTFLSGGLDSSTVTALAAQHLPGLNAFTVDFDVAHRSEAGDAAVLAEHLGLNHHIVRMEGREFEAFSERFVDIYDEPFGDTSGLPTYVVSALAAGKVKVALSGDGGDEVFGGYVPMFRRLVDDGGAVARFPGLTSRALYHLPVKFGARFLQMRLPAAQRVQESPVYLRSGQKRPFFSTEALHDYHIGRDYDDTWFFTRNLDRSGDPIRDRMALDFYTWLPEKMLTKVDRASMANSLEVRVPLLDHRLVEFMFSLPRDCQWNPERGAKWVLRGVLDRHVPPELTRRPKRGFTIPLNEWLGDSRDFWSERLRSSRIVREGVLSQRKLPYADTRSPLTRWLLLNIALWSDRYSWSL